MAKKSNGRVSELFGNLVSFMRICICRVLSVGPIPMHIAFIMDGNRRYAKKENMKEGAGHRAGFLTLITILNYCYELGVKYVTIYAFSIENFKRRPDEVQDLMDLMLEKMEELLKKESIVNQNGIRVYFIGNLMLLSEPVRIAAEKVMRNTANNTKCTLLICVAYTSCDEIVHAVQESCKNKRQDSQPLNSSKPGSGDIEVLENIKKINGIIPQNFQEIRTNEVDGSRETKASSASNGLTGLIEGDRNESIMDVLATQRSYENKWDKDQTLMENRILNGVLPYDENKKMQGEDSAIKLVDVEKCMYMAVAPEPDILIRSSGETRLSNFLLWQASDCMLYSPDALWPEIGLWHLVWAVLNYQRNYSYLEKKIKQL